MSRPSSPFLPIINSPSGLSANSRSSLKASRPSSPFSSEIPAFIRSPLRPRKLESDHSVASNSIWESEASVCISKGRYDSAIACLSKVISEGDAPASIQTFFNRSVCYEKLGHFGLALQDALTLFRHAEDSNKLHLKHFRRLAVCQMNSNLFLDAQNTLIQSDLFESRTSSIKTFLSNSTLSNERIKLADLRRDLAIIMKKGTKNKKNTIFGSLSSAVASQLNPQALTSSMSLYSDIQGAEETELNGFLELDDATREANEMKELVKSMTIWDARADMKQVRRESRKKRAEAEKLAMHREKSNRKIVHSFESLSRMSSRSSVTKLKDHVGKFKSSKSGMGLLLSANGSPRSSPSIKSDASSPELLVGSPAKRKPRCPFPVATELTKGKYKKIEFPRYVRFHSQYRKKGKKKSTHIGKTLQRLEQGQANSHEKYVFKDKMQLCKLVSILGRDNTKLTRYLTGENKIVDEHESEESEYTDDSDYDSEFDASDYDDSRPNTATSKQSWAARAIGSSSRTRRSSHAASRPNTGESEGGSIPRQMSGRFAILGRHKSEAILALDAKMEEQNYDGEDGRLKFPGLLA